MEDVRNIVPLPHQLGFLQCHLNLVLFGGGAGGGKALKNGSKVLTPKGWVNIEDMSIGDDVVTPFNGVQKVTGVFPQGLVDIYKVSFQDGREIECCKDHLWSLWKARKGNVNKRIIYKTSDLVDLVGGGSKLMTPLPINLDYGWNSELPLHPYLMGFLLGDGCFRGLGVTFTTNDEFVAEKISSLGYKVSKHSSKDRAQTYGVVGISGIINELGLRHAGSYEKFVPEIFKDAGIESRRQIVQGLMDSDGYVSKDGKMYYYSVSKRLADDFQYLVRSLGAYASISEKYTKYNGERVKSYAVYFNHKNAKDLVSLPRKLDLVRQKNTANGLRIENLVSTGVAQATCISISGVDKLFITNDFIVTHNTFAAILDNLQGIHDPNYYSVFFRTQSTEIEQDLWPRVKRAYHSILHLPNGKKRGKARIDEKAKIITFPSGARTKFAHLSNDKDADAYYGIEIAKIYFEEFQFRSWYQFTLLNSRNRSMAKVTKGIRCTLNPDPNHFVYKFVERFLDEDKYPIKELSGKQAYFTILDDQLYTAWEESEIYEMFPHLKPGVDIELQTYTYFPATLEDNTELMNNDPGYRAKLMGQPSVKRKQLLLGCWSATDDVGVYFKREWLKQTFTYPKGCRWVRSYDLAFSEKTPTTDPDFTAGIKVGKCSQGYYYLVGDYVDEFCEDKSPVKGRMRKRSGERDRIILKQAQYDTKDCDLVLPEDAGAAGKDSFIEKTKFFLSRGFKVRRDPSGHNAKKLTKFEPFCVAAEHGLVYIVRNTFSDETYEAIMNELEIFDGVTKSGRKRKDDWVDCTGSGFNYLAKQVVIPSLSLPTLSGTKLF